MLQQDKILQTLGRVDEKVDKLCDTVTKLERILTGNGNPEKGMVLRVVNLESGAKTRTRLLWAIFVAAITSAMALVFAILGSRWFGVTP